MCLPFGPGPVGVTTVGFGPMGRKKNISPFIGQTKTVWSHF